MSIQITEIAKFTDQIEKMAAFYEKLLGVNPVAKSEGMAIFMSGATKIFIHKKYAPGEGDLPPENHIAFTVDSVDDTVAVLISGGLTVEVEPADYYWGRSAYLRDPDGHLIELTESEK